jgi:hypothetical protein
MKPLHQLLMTGLILMFAQGCFAQEPRRAVVAQDPVGTAVSREQLIVVGEAQQHPTPLILPKALPPLNPSLGEIARAARAAHAAAVKAEKVVSDETDQQQQKVNDKVND